MVVTRIEHAGFNFVVEGVPKAQKQTRFRVSGGRPMCYDPSKADKEQIRWQIKPNCPEEPVVGPVELTLAFYMPIPKGVSAATRRQMVNRIVLPDKKPDEDNLAYLVTNALKGLVYEDDKQICAKHVYKFYGERPKTVIQVLPIFTLESFGYPGAVDLA